MTYMVIPTSQCLQFLEDPQQFITNEEYEFTIKELKSWCSDFMHELVDQHSLLTKILKNIDNFFSYDNLLVNSQTSDIEKHYMMMKSTEIGFYCLGTLNDEIQNNIDDLEIDFDNIARDIIIPLLTNSSEIPLYLQCRALWT